MIFLILIICLFIIYFICLYNKNNNQFKLPKDIINIKNEVNDYKIKCKSCAYCNKIYYHFCKIRKILNDVDNTNDTIYYIDNIIKYCKDDIENCTYYKKRITFFVFIKNKFIKENNNEVI